MIYALANLLVDVVILVFFLFMLIPIVRGAPYVPIHRRQQEKAFQLAPLKPGDKIADLGSGDGRLLMEAAKKGAVAYGFEINPFLVWHTKRVAKRQGLEESVFCSWSNFWSQDFSDFDVVYIYGITYIMKGLEKKLQKELKPGARAVVFIFPFPNWPLQQKDNGVYIYEQS